MRQPAHLHGWHHVCSAMASNGSEVASDSYAGMTPLCSRPCPHGPTVERASERVRLPMMPSPQAGQGATQGPPVAVAGQKPAAPPKGRKGLCLKLDVVVNAWPVTIRQWEYYAIATCLTISATLSIVFSLAVPALIVNGTALPECQVGILFWRIVNFLVSGELDQRTILALWWTLPILGTVSLTFSVSLHATKHFLNPVKRQLLAAAVRLASLLYTVLLVAYPAAYGFQSGCPCVYEWRAAWDKVFELQYGYYLSLGAGVLTFALATVSRRIRICTPQEEEQLHQAGANTI